MHVHSHRIGFYPEIMSCSVWIFEKLQAPFSVLHVCGVMLLDSLCPAFLDNLMLSSGKVEMFSKIWGFLTLEDGTVTLSQNKYIICDTNKCILHTYKCTSVSLLHVSESFTSYSGCSTPRFKTY